MCIRDRRIGVVAFAVESVHPHDVGQVLDSQDIAVRVGHHCAIPLHHFFGVRSSTRASVGPTTTREEIDRFIEALGPVSYTHLIFGDASSDRSTISALRNANVAATTVDQVGTTQGTISAVLALKDAHASARSFGVGSGATSIFPPAQ